MKKLLFIPIAFALFSLSACNKWKDFWDDHDNDTDFKSYRITKWERVKGPGEEGTGTTAYFGYDKHNNPLYVMFNEQTTGDNGTHWTFMYDNQNRLARCYMHYGSDPREDYLYYRKFVYGSNGRIMADTLWLARSEQDRETEPTPATDSYALTFYFYDAQGRITKVQYFDEGTSVPYFERNYSYDANGNMVRPGYTYDNKVNFMRTNKVWQFINHDYSKNNPVPAVSYNNAKLPKQFDSAPGTFGFLNRSYNRSTFTYEKVY